MRKAMIAFGGNALIKADEPAYQKQQIENAKEAAEILVSLLRQNTLPIVVHGNGPQVGNILIQQEEASNRVPPYTMDLCGAQTQGSIGYMLQRCTENLLSLYQLEQPVATVLTEVVVDRQDQGFTNPTKPVGPFYEAFRARQLEIEKNWVMKEDSGRGWRRLVPSPIPREIVQLPAIRHLIDHGFLVLACGGGGIPIIRDASGFLVGVEAVIDKDLTAALLARALSTDMFIILTAVEKVSIHFGTPQQRDLGRITVDEARTYLAEGHFPPGSMGPKIQAALAYLEGGGHEVIITTAEALMQGKLEEVGTHIVAAEHSCLT